MKNNFRIHNLTLVVKNCFFLFTCVLFICTSVSAQLLDNSQGLAFTDYPFFNKKFIASAKIKEIKGEYTFKKQGDKMRESNFVYVYQFDSIGRIIQHYETAKGEIVNDTVVRNYVYNENGDLIALKKSQKSGFLSTEFVYDSLHRVVQEDVFREIDSANSLLNPNIERRILWNSERMEYNQYNGQFKKRIYNSNNVPYLEVTKLYDTLGYLKSVEEYYLISRRRLQSIYSYSDKGCISNITTSDISKETPLEEVRFAYDNYSNLLSKEVFKNGIFTTEYQVIYSNSTGLLSSILIREISSNFISIIRFEAPVFWK